MPLSERQIEALKAAAKSHGVDENQVIASAQAMAGDPSSEDGAPTTPTEEAALTAERFLVGFLPYVTVRELRTHVLGLPNTTDDNLFTGEWLEIHGVSAAVTPGVPPTLTGAKSDDGSNGRDDEVTPTQKGEEKQ